jgi:hypothetical protein
MGGRYPGISHVHRVSAVAALLALAAGSAFAPAAAAPAHVRPDGGLDLVAIQATIDSLGLRFAIAQNEFTDLTALERQRFGGGRQPVDGVAPVGAIPPSGRDLPAAFQWRDHEGGNFVTGVRHQGPCGACWVFAPVALLESWLLIHRDTPGAEVDLSEQHVLSCAAPYNDCQGGSIADALDFLVDAGVTDEACFPYVAQHTVPCDASCEDTPLLLEHLANWTWVTGGSHMVDIETIKDALVDGPVTTWMRLHESFYAYDEGVYAAHGSPATQATHYVLIVGWDDHAQCWIAKNSWGRYWGEDGFFRIAYDSGCGFGRWTARALGCETQPRVLDFSVATIGQVQEQVFTLTNWELRQLAGEVSWSHDEFFVEPTSYVLGPGQQQVFVVTYAPTDHGDDTCWIDTGQECRLIWCRTSGPTVATELVAWGSNNRGQCNIPAVEAEFVAVAAGEYHSLALRDDGSILAWGSNSFGQSNVPAPNSGFVAIAAGHSLSAGVRGDGSIAVWGRNSYGELNVPGPNSGFVSVAAGDNHVLGLRNDGTVVAWGRNNHGQCNVPVPNENFVAVVGGQTHSLGLKADGTLVAWGGFYHEVTTIPQPNAGFTAIAAGSFHNLALRDDGSIAAWGAAGAGQTGVPEPNQDFVAVAASRISSMGLRSDGSVIRWGWGLSYPDPVPNEGILVIAAGHFHFLAIRSTQTVSLLPPADDASPLAVPTALAIDRVAPNPFNPGTTIWYDLPRAGTATLAIHDLRGRLVRTLWQGTLPGGRHTQAWDGMDARGRAAPSGIYLVRLQMNDGSRRMVRATLVR